MVHITTNEIQRRHAADSFAISLPERAIDRTPGLQVSAFILLRGTANHLAETRLSEVGSDEPMIAHSHSLTGVRIDHAPEVSPGARHLICMPPKVRQLPFVPPHHEQRRPWADLPLPANTRTLVVLPQAKIG